MLSEVEPNWHHSSPAVANQPRTVGNRRFEIPRELLLYLVDYEITIPDMSRALGVSESPGGGGSPYNGLYGEAPPERGAFFRLQVYKRVGISQV